MSTLKVSDVIDQAIRENRLREWLLLGFAILFVILGAVVLVWGIVEDSLVAWAGIVESVLFVPAIILVRRISHENTALRLLEIPLRKARTAEEAGRVLMEFFASAYGIHRSDEKEG